MSWFKRILPKVMTDKKKGVPEGIWDKCPKCSAVLYREELERNQLVCPQCDHHFRLSARQRLSYFLDEDHVTELAQDVKAHDFLKFRDSKKYKDRLSQAYKQTNETEALLVMAGTLKTKPILAMSFNFNFIGGTMGAAVGERFVRGIEVAIAEQRPVVCFSTSGGARMQEGLFSLLQMAKTSCALTDLSAAKLPFVSVLTDPTMGGVSASLATLGDVIFAEPKALIGFSGPRVIEQTIRETLPEGFQRSEFLLKHGAIDDVVHRSQLRDTIFGVFQQLLWMDR